MVITNNRLLDLLIGKNKKRKGRSILSLAIIFLILAACLAGCGVIGKLTGRQAQQPQPNQAQQEQRDKIPEALTQMEASIENIFEALGGPAVRTAENGNQSKDQTSKKDQAGSQDQNKPKEQQGQQGNQQQSNQQQSNQQQGTQQQNNQQGTQQQNNQQGGQQQNNQQSQDQGKQQDQQTQQSDPWQQVTLQIAGLHTQWNDSLPEITKKGAQSELVDGFSKSLNDLTRIASDKDKMKTMLAASGLYANIPDMYALYKSPANPALKEIIYFTRDAVLNADIGQWDKSAADLEKLKSAWGYFKNTIEKEKLDAAAKVDLSITELAKVIADRDARLTDLKGRLVLSNLEALEQ